MNRVAKIFQIVLLGGFWGLVLLSIYEQGFVKAGDMPQKAFWTGFYLATLMALIVIYTYQWFKNVYKESR